MKIIFENMFVKYKFNINTNILLITIKNLYPSDVEWEETIQYIKYYYKYAEENNIIFSIIFDLRKMGLISFKQINEWGDLFISYKDKTKLYVQCSTMITDSYIIKNVLNIFFNLYTTVKPMKIVSNINDAYNFINSI
tara:strand:+ start:487 stop:897 length:411 start_codon:yes stop_codon:yes gene_type:complete